MKAREGDLIEIHAGLIFDVKGLIHPPSRIIAFPRFIPATLGNRTNKYSTYRKVYSLSERFEFLKQQFPHYLIDDPVFHEKLCEVPIDAVKRRYKPIEKLQELRTINDLDSLQNLAMRLAKTVKDTTKIPWEAIGISGSILVELHKSYSDIDPIIYGSENCRKVYQTLKDLLSEEYRSFNPYVRKDLDVLFEFRSKDTIMDYEDFVRTESRKVLQGKFLQRDYFIRFVKDWSEVHEKYGDVQYTNVGYARVKATVVDDSESIFTPCTYKISDVRTLEGQQKRPLKEITSFRGRFCEQAREGEVIIAQGKVERVKHVKENSEYFRLLLGNRPSDFMILA